jgi:hypothetical protein
MLRTLLLWLGVLALPCAALTALSGNYAAALWLLVNGLIFTLGTVFERWRYKPTKSRQAARGLPTGERFVNPKSGALMEVYYDAASGERSYVLVKGAPPPSG